MIKHDCADANWYDNQQESKKSDGNNNVYDDSYAVAAPASNNLFYISSELSKGGEGIEEKEIEESSRKSYVQSEVNKS